MRGIHLTSSCCRLTPCLSTQSACPLRSSRHCTARVEMATRIGADAAILALNRRKAFSETCGPIGVRYTGYTANNIAENILRAKGTPLFSSDTSTIRVLGVPGSEARRLAKAIQTWNPYVSIEEVERLSYGAW